MSKCYQCKKENANGFTLCWECLKKFWANEKIPGEYALMNKEKERTE